MTTSRWRTPASGSAHWSRATERITSRRRVVADIALSVAASVVMAFLVFLGGVAIERLADVRPAIDRSVPGTTLSTPRCEWLDDEVTCASGVTWADTFRADVE